ncbi:hypothetical protein IAT38_005320 [Cryptococcus sp. DSM 104549]
MRFAVADSSDDDADIVSLDYDYSESSSGDESFGGFQWCVVSRTVDISKGIMRRVLRAAAESSSDEASALDSDDEIDTSMLGLESFDEDEFPPPPVLVPVKSKTAQAPRLMRLSTSSSMKGKMIPRKATPVLPVSRKQLRAEDIVREEPSNFDRWMKQTEQDAWREGQQLAQKRRKEIRDIATNARTRVQDAENAKMEREADEMRRLMEGMAIKQVQEEEEVARKFQERERRLWKDIDDVIKEVARKEAEASAAAQAVAAAAARKQKEEEDARNAAAEKAALAQQAEIARRAKELALKEQQEKAEREAQEKQNAEAKAAQEAQDKAAAKKGEAGALWRRNTERQKWMKKEVIEPVKADKAVLAGLRKGRMMMQRWLGQVTNSRDSIVRVTNDIHDALCQQLPAPPSTASPITLTDDIPRPYAYLLSHISKVLIGQAQEEMAPYPLAKIVLGLMLRGHAAFGEILFARFVKKCPWVVPFYPARVPDQPREEFEKSTGRGTDESNEAYILRMSHIASLFFVILQTPLSPLIPTLPAPPSPTELETLIPPTLRLPYAWTWLSLALKDPMAGSAPVATLVTKWLDICWHEVRKVYGPGQTDKLWEVLEREGVQGVRIKGDSQEARDQLWFAVGQVKTGQAKVPTGRDWDL